MERNRLSFLAAILALLYCTFMTVEGALDFGYHNYEETQAFIMDLASRYPNLTHTYSIGQSVEGRELTVLVLGSRPREYVHLRPDVKYVGNMHGNEIVNAELLLHLAEHLLTSYGQNETLTSFLDNTRIHLMPSMNPDGAKNASEYALFPDNYKTWNGTTNKTIEDEICGGYYGRLNKNNVDLNRNFPDYFDGNNFSPRQPETRAVMNWLTRYQFVLSANLHGGALLANIPLDSYINATTVYSWAANYSASVDDDVFKHLARTYSYSHSHMYKGEGCPKIYPGAFPEGIVNGAQWYPIIGGMQDYNYIYSGCMELVLEVHCCKFAPVHYIPTAWVENKDALIHYLQQVHMGVKGTIRDNKELEMKNAEVRIVGREFFVVRTTPNGEFWRILLPGNYTLMVTATAYEDYYKDIVVKQGQVTVVNITMDRRMDYGPKFKPPEHTCEPEKCEQPKEPQKCEPNTVIINGRSKAAYPSTGPCWVVLATVVVFMIRNMVV